MRTHTNMLWWHSCTDTLTHSTSPGGAQPLTGSVALCIHLATSYQPLRQVDGWLDSLRQTPFMGVFKAKTKTQGKEQTEASSSQNCLVIHLLCIDSQTDTRFVVINLLLHLSSQKSIRSIFPVRSLPTNSMLTNSMRNRRTHGWTDL